MTSVVRHAPLVSVEDKHAPEVPEVGTWWWVLDKQRWLGCVTAVGSNYVELTGVSHKKYYSPPQARVHLDKISEELRYEPDAEIIIGEQVEKHRSIANRLMEEVRALTGRLGISIGALPEVTGSETQAIALRSGTEPIEQYKTALEKAKKETLPKLFERIGEENEAMARWMTANLLPLQSRVSQLKPAIKKIEDQIFRVELYAGLVEEVEKITGGEPADLAEPVHLFQRRAYMDEECLVAYQAGGMHFKDISAFDRWICRHENRDRLLPFKRCILAFKVRRFLGEIDALNMSDYISMWYERELDKLTFLYIRNGEQVHRLRTAIEFGADLFPDLSRIKAEGQLWAKFDGSTIKYLGSDDEYAAWMGYKDRCEAWEREGRDYYWVWDHAVSEGASKHWILDDNMDGFYRLNDNQKIKVIDFNPFTMVEVFSDRYTNVALAGMQYEFFADRRCVHPPYLLNTRVYSCILINHRLQHRWRGMYNEDTDLSLRALKDGWCTVLFNAVLVKKMPTMKISGGNTDELYKGDGRLKMAESLRDQHPDVVKITQKWGRWQHHVNYKPFRKNKLIPLDTSPAVPVRIGDAK